MREVDVDAEGVKGAKNFFEAKVHRYYAVDVVLSVQHFSDETMLMFIVSKDSIEQRYLVDAGIHC